MSIGFLNQRFGTAAEKGFVFALLVLSLIAVGLVLYATVWGAGLISDSFQYIATAKTVVRQGFWGYPAEDGSMIPLAQYPPFFPAVLALLEAVGINALSGVRLLNAGLMGANVFLVGITARRMTNQSAFGLLAAVFVLSNRAFIEAHCWALSEPLYLFLALVGLIILVDSQPHQHLRLGWIALWFALAPLTRYIGIALIGCGMVMVFSRTQPRRAKWIDSLAFGLMGVLPLALWTVRTAQLTTTINNRVFDYEPLTNKNLLSLFQTMGGWFVPSPWLVGHEKIWVLLLSLGVLGLLIGGLVFWRKGVGIAPSSPLRHPLAVAWGLYAFLHIVFLILAKVGFDHNIGFGDRLLLPAWLGGMIWMSAGIARLWQQREMAARFLGIGVALYLLLYFSVGSAASLPRWHKQGLGLARRSWHDSQAIQTLRSLDSGRVYSNSPSTVYLWAGSPGYSLNEFAQRRESHSSELAYLVVFHHIPANARLQRLSADLPVIIEDRIATIYRYPP